MPAAADQRHKKPGRAARSCHAQNEFLAIHLGAHREVIDLPGHGPLPAIHGIKARLQGFKRCDIALHPRLIVAPQPVILTRTPGRITPVLEIRKQGKQGRVLRTVCRIRSSGRQQQSQHKSGSGKHAARHTI